MPPNDHNTPRTQSTASPSPENVSAVCGAVDLDAKGVESVVVFGVFRLHVGVDREFSSDFGEQWGLAGVPTASLYRLA
jgi:hypothetical protein